MIREGERRGGEGSQTRPSSPMMMTTAMSISRLISARQSEQGTRPKTLFSDRSRVGTEWGRAKAGGRRGFAPRKKTWGYYMRNDAEACRADSPIINRSAPLLPLSPFYGTSHSLCDCRVNHQVALYVLLTPNQRVAFVCDLLTPKKQIDGPPCNTEKKRITHPSFW